MNIRNLLKTPSKATEQLLNNLIANVSDIIAVTDARGRITHHSKSLEKAVNNAGISAVPRDAVEIIEENSEFEYSKLLEYVRREKKPVIDFRIKTVLGTGDRESLLSIIPVGSIAESTLKLLHLVRPVKDTNAPGPDLGHLEKLTNVGKIAAGMAHELNTPLGSIVLSAEYIMDAVDNQELKQEATRIKSRAEHCSKVVKELLGFVRHDDQAPRSYNLMSIVTKVVDLVSSDMKRRDIAIVVSEAEGDTNLECSENQIEQLLFNLIANASHAIDTDGRIDISIRRDSLLNRIHCAVADNGDGIGPDNLQKIFDPFFTTKAGEQGTGLGLSLCKKIAVEHGGDITVNSVVGQGTTFEVWFPLGNE